VECGSSLFPFTVKVLLELCFCAWESISFDIECTVTIDGGDRESGVLFRHCQQQSFGFRHRIVHSLLHRFPTRGGIGHCDSHLVVKGMISNHLCFGVCCFHFLYGKLV